MHDMPDHGLAIRAITIRAVNAPLKRPVRTAMGSVLSAPLVLIDVDVGEGIVGRAYIFAYTTDALGALARLLQDIKGAVIGLQWAFGMHGFAPAAEDENRALTPAP